MVATSATERTAHRKKRQQVAEHQEERAARDEVFSAAIERDPRSYGDAIRSSGRTEWQTAMKEEITALDQTDVLPVTKRIPGSNSLYSKWVSNTKTGADGELELYKARLVACGNDQLLGVDST